MEPIGRREPAISPLSYARLASRRCAKMAQFGDSPWSQPQTNFHGRGADGLPRSSRHVPCRALLFDTQSARPHAGFCKKRSAARVPYPVSGRTLATCLGSDHTRRHDQSNECRYFSATKENAGIGISRPLRDRGLTSADLFSRHARSERYFAPRSRDGRSHAAANVPGIGFAAAASCHRCRRGAGGEARPR